MATVKVFLMQPNRPNADGRHGLAIRITIGRKSTYTSLGVTVKASEWDTDAQRVRKNHPNSTRLNNLILKKLAETNEKLFELETEKTNVSAVAVKNSIKPKASATFFVQAEIYIDQLKQRGKYSQHQAETSRIKAFREFMKGADIAFSDITVSLLEKFALWLKGSRTRKLTERSIINHHVTIRAVFSHAIKEHPTLEKYYPFGKKGISIKYPESMKIGLTVEEVKRIEELELEPLSPIDHARNIWLMSFYFAGARNGDILLLRWTDFHDGRLHYTMGKNNKPGSIMVGQKAAQILAKYEPLRDETNLVFTKLRDLKDWKDKFEIGRQVSFVNRSLNKTLKLVAAKVGVDKTLSMHISRHTFGNIAADKIPVQTLQKLYRHSSITTTIGYQSSFIHAAGDDALDAVTGF